MRRIGFNQLGALPGLGMTYISLNPDDVGGGGGDSAAPQNNGGGNTGDSPAPGETQDNSGQAPDPEAFWRDPSAEGGENNSGDDDNDSGQQTGQQIMESIQQFSVGDIFTPQIAQEVAEGNFENLNKQFNSMAQNVMRQSIVSAARIMKDFEASLDGRMRSMINSNQTQQTDEQMLSTNFQTYTDPAMQPVIRGVFQQAIKHANGDRKKALAATKDMLRVMGQSGRQDFGIESPPSNPDDYMSEGANSLVKDLLAMSN